MSFERYIASAQGYRAQLENCIALGKSRIGLGTYQLPFEYAIIYYDKALPAIMFAKGNKGNGFKVQKATVGNTTFLAAKSFTKLGYIPLGIYERTDDVAEVFKLLAPELAIKAREPKS